MNDFDIESELQRGLPRPIRRRRGSLTGVGCIRIFILPHMCVGVFVLLMALHQTAALLIGQAVPAQVQNRSIHRSRKGGITYQLRSTYSWAGVEYKNSASVTAGEYDTVNDGSTLQVRLLPILPQYGVLITPNASLIRLLLFPWFFALFWNSIMSVFVYALYYVPYISKEVIRRGLPMRGRIIDKRTSTNKSTTYYLKYEFTPSGGFLIQSEMTVDAASWSMAQIGDEETVLYLPKRPKQSAIYKYAEFEVRG